MKRFYHTFILLLLVSFSLNFWSQNLVYNNSNRQEKSITDGKYKYSNATCDVIVEFNNDIYMEYYPNNEFIMAKIKWISKKEYILEIIEIQKEDLPFSIGTNMKTKIVKNKGNFIYYESELQGLTWSGKFEKIEDNTI